MKRPLAYLLVLLPFLLTSGAAVRRREAKPGER
jgi:hypothetical protein